MSSFFLSCALESDREKLTRSRNAEENITSFFIVNPHICLGGLYNLTDSPQWAIESYSQK